MFCYVTGVNRYGIGSVVVLDGAAIFVAGCQFMPPPDFFLAELPAQIDDSTVSDMWKIAQPEIDVFDDDSQLMDGAKACADVLKTVDVMRSDRRPAAIDRVGRRLPDFLTSVEEYGFPSLKGREIGLKLWDQPVGFGKRKNPLRVVVVVWLRIVRHKARSCVAYFRFGQQVRLERNPLKAARIIEMIIGM